MKMQTPQGAIGVRGGMGLVEDFAEVIVCAQEHVRATRHRVYPTGSGLRCACCTEVWNAKDTSLPEGHFAQQFPPTIMGHAQLSSYINHTSRINAYAG